MNEKNKVHQVNKRTVAFFLGVALCLLSVILVMNVGYVARGIAFPFFYLFGTGSYILYLWMYAVGISLLFRGKGIKITFSWRTLGFILLFLSLSMISTLAFAKKSLPTMNFLKEFNDVLFLKQDGSFASNGGYWNTLFINMFGSYPFGGGLLGYALVGLLYNGMKSVGCWTFAILIGAFGFLLLFVKEVASLIQKRANREKKEKKKVEKAAVMPQKEVKQEPTRTSLAYAKRDDRDMIKDAARLDVNPSNDDRFIEPMPARQIKQQPVDFNENNIYSRNEPETMYRPSYAGEMAGNNTGFVPARYVRKGEQPVNNSVQNASINPVHPSFEAAGPINNPVSTPAPTPAPTPVEEKVEQLQLDFNAKQELNETLVTAKPVFQDAKPNVQPMANQIKVEEPIKKEPIKWVPPSSSLLEDWTADEAKEQNEAVAKERMEAINGILAGFGVGAYVEDYIVGPSITNFRVKYEHNVQIKSVGNLIQEISMRLGGVPTRFQAVVEGSPYSAIEVSNAVITSVAFKEVFTKLKDVKKHPLNVAFGKDIKGEIITADFNDFPHILVSGTTGSGKSVFVHSIISSLIMRNSPDDLKLVLIDPKQVEMSIYKNIPHLLCPVITDMKKAKVVMEKLAKEMNRRYGLFEDSYTRSIDEYNEYAKEEGKETLPFILVFIDEYADLVQTYKEVSQPVVSIAQKARAAGIHMLIATQRPSTDVITGVIKGNLPTRVALAVANQVDSVTIIGEGGAEKLLGRGDMLVSSPLVSKSGPVRLQGCYIKSQELRHIMGYLKEHYQVNYDPEFLNLEEEAEQKGEELVNSPAFNGGGDDGEEAKYKSVKEWVMSNKYMSMSRIQRECGVGFNRAGRFFKRLQDEGVVGTEVEGNKGCPVLTNDEFYDNDDDNMAVSDEVRV
ncbi:MAG: DUF87 domain-containing protein [Bacilli bacterium]|nr:DUF87 domain-containing protein [Bacilli bacterium]